MIEYKRGDLLQELAEALVNTVNCVGVMGRGVALQFKKAFPENFKAYAAACQQGKVKPGRMFVFELDTLMPRYIINFPTKRHWRGNSRIEDIEAGLQDLVRVIREKRIRSIALPPLGVGLGGLPWPDVRQRIEQALSELEDVRVIVFEPLGAPSAKAMVRNARVPNMTMGRAALVTLIDRYLKGLLDPQITLLEVHKLMYFLQETGEPLRLRFVKARYGPYAENLRHVLNAIEGHLVQGYGDRGDAPEKPLHLLPGAVEMASNYLQAYPETSARCNRVAQLVEGFESPFGLELLSSVHWVIEHEAPATRDDLVQRIYAWDERKRLFTPRQIQLASDVLTRLDWIAPVEHAEHGTKSTQHGARSH